MTKLWQRIFMLFLWQPSVPLLADDLSPQDCRWLFLPVPKEACANGLCLVQSRYGYGQNMFPQKMAAAIDLAQVNILRALEKKEKIAPSTVRSIMDQIAFTRQEIAREANSPESNKYGLRLPTRASEMDGFTAAFLPQSKLSFFDFRVRDVIGDPKNQDSSSLGSSNPLIPFYEGPRHQHFFSAAEAILQQRSIEGTDPYYVIGEEKVPLSKLVLVKEKNAEGKEFNFIFVEHPSLENMEKLRSRAFELISEVLSQPVRGNLISDLNQLAQAQFLLMHGTPYYRGSPAIVESMLDAILRAKHQRSIGSKVGEPFWDVMFWNKDPTLYGGKDLFKNFSTSGLKKSN